MSGSKPDNHEPRRPHRKSRNGCLVCKQRRVKCDERRPICSNCATRDRPCAYSRPLKILDPRQEDASTPRSSTNSNTWSDEGGTSTRSPFSEIHMVLLHHAETQFSRFMVLECAAQPILDLAVESAFASPFLLNQLLALSALHLSTQVQQSDRRSYYHNHATELQTRALSLFNDAKEGVSEDNYIPSFLFATLLGIHVLRDTLINQDQGLGNFVSTFVSYARLHRGVRAVTNKYWHKLQESELKPLLYMSDRFSEIEKIARGTDTRDLHDFFASNSDIGSASVGICLEALDWVQRIVDIAEREPTRPDVGLHAVMAWPLIISDEYIDALYRCRPEAIVVLAYYAAVLHRQRSFWVFENTGSSLVRLIASHLGAFWTDALAWPFRVLNED